MLKAKHVHKIIKKWRTFRKGRIQLEHIISEHPDIVTPRFIRYCIQNNAPNILNYNNKIDEDERFIYENGTDYQRSIILEIKIADEYLD